MDLLEDDSPHGSTTSLDEESQSCKICNDSLKQPKVLSCLHVFCELCLEKVLNGNVENDSENGLFDSDDSSLNTTHTPCEDTGRIKCPKCEQETEVPHKSVSSLLPDYVMCNQLDMTAIENMNIICTSCKAKEKAVARCSDCSNFLCPNCVSAHHYMRCFENHKVVTFEEMKSNSDSAMLHKPIACTKHTGELMKFFCHTCQKPICNECLVNDHSQPEHQYERITDVEQKEKKEIDNLMQEGKNKLNFCEDVSNQLQTTLLNLEMQRDNAKSHIEECIQSYKAAVEKCGESLLKELENIHLKKEMSVMDAMHSISEIGDKIEDACKFVEKLIENGNGVEILSLKQLVGSQLLSLINNTPKPDTNVSIEFETDSDKFENAVKSSFGNFKSEILKANGEASPITSSIDTDVFALPSGVISPDSLPSSNNLDLELSKYTSSAIAEYNLHQLAELVQAQEQQRIASPQSSGHSSQQSPAAVHAAAMSLHEIISSSGVATPTDSSAHLNTVNNLTVLAKLGSLSLSNNGQILLNGQVVPGLARDAISPIATPTMRSSGPTSPLVSGHSAISSQNMSCLQPSPIDSVSPNSLGALLNGTTPRSMSPHPDNQMMNGGLQSIGGQLNGPAPRSATTKLSPMQIRCKFGQLGPGKGQFNSPHGFCLGLDEDIIVADTNNHRIQVFDKTGEFKYQFGIPGKEEGQLWYPRKVAVMRNSGKYVVCDRGNERSRMQIFSKNGHFIKKIAIRYIDIVAGLAINSNGHIVAVDSVSPTVFVIGESGDLLRWFDCSDYMREPSDIAISGKEFYVCDFKGHCVVVFNEEGKFSRRIGCENITNFPNGIDISDAGDILVGDSHGNRFHVAVFYKDGSLLSEFECPYVKVSRCCGLKITSEGYVVTLAKNNHHVLVLNTLYIA